MTETNETLSLATDAQLTRDLPHSIVIPPITGEMVHLRPATVEDLLRLDELDAFYGASKITGKDAATERAVVHT
ncbi:GNAT family N-acetyltransferase, partial [Bifidobacterium breve]